MNWGKGASVVFALCATLAIVLRAQTFTTLHSFNGTDGELPEAGLVQATNGDFYGTTFLGGANHFGTVFKIAPTGALTTAHSFEGTDGEAPETGLLQAGNGDLYGTTVVGGASGAGTVFKITPNGALTTLHSFDGTDGSAPGALIQAADGTSTGQPVWAGPKTLGQSSKSPQAVP